MEKLTGKKRVANDSYGMACTEVIGWHAVQIVKVGKLRSLTENKFIFFLVTLY